jgi:hypothetical protein
MMIPGRIAAGAGFGNRVSARVQPFMGQKGGAPGKRHGAGEEQTEDEPSPRHRPAARRLRLWFEKAPRGVDARRHVSPRLQRRVYAPMPIFLPRPAGLGRDRAHINPMRVFLLMSLLALSGCSILAAPCRVTSAVVGAVPVVGGVAATPTNACGNVIDP